MPTLLSAAFAASVPLPLPAPPPARGAFPPRAPRAPRRRARAPPAPSPTPAPLPPRAAAAALPPREQGGRSGPRAATVRAAAARKAGDLRRADAALAPYADGTDVAVLNERVLVAVAKAAKRVPRERYAAVLARVERMVGASDARPNSRTFNAVLSALRVARDEEGEGVAEECLRLGLRVVAGMGSVKPDSYTMSLVFRLCGSARNADAAERFADLLGGEEVLDAVAGTALVAAYARAGDVERADAALAGMRDRGVPANERAYAAVISAYARSGMHTRVIEATREAAAAAHVRLNLFVLSGALASCARAGDAANARRFYEELLEAGVRPTQGALACVLDAAVRGGDVRLAQDVLFVWMRSRRIVPSRDQINRVIALCGRVGASGGGGRDEIMRLLDVMAGELGVAPDLGTFNVAVAALGKCKCVALARVLVETQFPKINLIPNLLTYNALINGCATVGKPYMAFELLHEMRGRAVQPDQTSYNAVLEQCCRAREPELVKQVLAEMDQVPYVSVNSRAVSSLLLLFRSRRDAPAAISVVQRFDRKNGMGSLEVSVYDTLAGICFDFGEEQHGAGVVGSLFVNNRASTGTFNAIISYRGLKCKDSGRARDAFDRMKAMGIAPDGVTYTTLIRACAQNGQMERAFRLLVEMQDIGLGADDTFAWVSIIDGFGRSGQWERSLEILQYMRSGGVGSTADRSSSSSGLARYGLVPAPNTAVYNAAIYAAGVGGGGWVASWDVFQLMCDDSGASPDHVTFSSLASSLLDDQVSDPEPYEFIASSLRSEASGIEGRLSSNKGTRRTQSQTLKRISAKVVRLERFAKLLRCKNSDQKTVSSKSMHEDEL